MLTIRFECVRAASPRSPWRILAILNETLRFDMPTQFMMRTLGRRRDGTFVDHGDLLLTLAEVSVAFAGFSGVVAVFGRRDPSSWSFSDRFRFFSLVESSLSLLLLCILPFGLFSVHITDESVWRAMSALIISYIVLSDIFRIVRLRAASSSERAKLASAATRVFAVGHVLVVILSVYNTVFAGEFGPFLVALIFILTRSGFLFARMLITGFGGRPAA